MVWHKELYLKLRVRGVFVIRTKAALEETMMSAESPARLGAGDMAARLLGL
jgi:hypothetical protein